MISLKRIFYSAALLLSMASMLTACGYSWQNRRNPWADHHITKVFIDVVSNDSLETGFEVPFTSALIKEFVKGRKIEVVGSRAAADAIVSGKIKLIDNKVSTAPSVTSLTNDKSAETLDNMSVAAEYSVAAGMEVRLIRISDGRVLWSQEFAESKLYPGNNRFGAIGSTSVLINESQKTMALEDIAKTLAGDAYDGMFEAF